MLEVTVELQGAARGGPALPAGPIELALPDTSTAGDLLHEVAGKLPEPFRSTLLPTGAGLPTRLRLFIDGQLAQRRDQRIAREGRSASRVIVVLASPISGGA